MVSTGGQREEEEHSRHGDSTLSEHPSRHPTVGWEGGGGHSARYKQTPCHENRLPPSDLNDVHDREQLD